MFRICAVAAVGLALLVPSSALSVTSAPPPASFVDPTGDSGEAPDISSVTVSHDDHGIVTFALGITNRPQLLSTDFVQVFVNFDGSSSTGEHGFDVAIQVQWPVNKLFFYFGSTWVQIGETSLRSSYADGQLTISAALFDLRVIGAFDFWVAAGADTGGTGMEDLAPDGEGTFYSYAVKVPLFFEHLDAPLAVKAGKAFTASMMLVTDGEAEGMVTCTATIGGNRVAGTARWLNLLITSPNDPESFIRKEIGREGDALCSFKVPKKARGKLISATITATRSGVVVSRTFSARVA
jgi:hypothetical protein